MSATVRHEDADNNNPEPTMFPGAETPIAPDAPPQDLPADADAAYPPTIAREAALDAVERALAATLRLQRTLPPAPQSALPPAPQLNERDEWPRRRMPSPFEGDVRRLRSRAPLEPVTMPVPPPEEPRTSTGTLIARIVGAVVLAAVAALFAVGAIPLPFGAQADNPREMVVAAPVSPERSALVERFAALRQQQVEQAPQPQPQPQVQAQPQPQGPQPQPQQQAQPQAIVPQTVKAERIVMPTAPVVRSLDPDEIAVLYDRSQALIEQGDITAARLMLTRAAEAGDARSALALGTTYDPDVLKKLGVLGVAANPAQAHAWYTKAITLGSPEAQLRLERLAQATR